MNEMFVLSEVQKDLTSNNNNNNNNVESVRDEDSQKYQSIHPFLMKETFWTEWKREISNVCDREREKSFIEQLPRSRNDKSEKEKLDKYSE